MTTDDRVATPVKERYGIMIDIYFHADGDSVHLDICHLDGVLISTSEVRPNADGEPHWTAMAGLLLALTQMPIMQTGLPVFWQRLVEKARKAEYAAMGGDVLKMAEDLARELGDE